MGKAAKRRSKKFTASQMESLAFTYGTLVDAQNSLGQASRIKLTTLIANDRKLAAAWQRGQFLRNLRNLASVPVTMDEAARRLNLANADELRTILDNDIEAANLWLQIRQDAFLRIKLALVKTALDGNQAAIRAVENLLHTEASLKNGFGINSVRISEICSLTGRTRTLVYKWVRNHGLSVSEDKTVELSVFFPWFENYLQTIHPKVDSQQIQRLHQMKAERIEVALKRQRHELLPREDVMTAILGRHQVLINAVRQKAPHIASLCHGQKLERIIKIITDSLTDICWQLCEPPCELYLPEAAAKGFRKVLEIGITG